MEDKLIVAVYAICKNEEKFVDRWMDSVEDADMVIVTDTGSTDNTVQKLRDRGAIVFTNLVDPWRFDVARNISLSHVPEEVHVCVCIDLDEVIESGWRDQIEEIWMPGVTGIKYLYTWSVNHDGTPGVTFWKEKIHSRHNFRWIHPVHEILSYRGPIANNYIESENIKITHYPDSTKSRSNYLPLLELAVKEDPTDDRNTHYLGREYMYYKMWDKCIWTLEKHLKLPRATWKDERCASMRFISRAYLAKGDVPMAKYWLYHAIAEAPHLREPYVEMAKLAYYSDKDWPTIYHMTEEALKIKERPRSYINEVSSWDYTIYDLGSLSCYNLGMFNRAYQLGKRAVELSPNNDRLKGNLKLYENKL